MDENEWIWNNIDEHGRRLKNQILGGGREVRRTWTNSDEHERTTTSTDKQDGRTRTSYERKRYKGPCKKYVSRLGEAGLSKNLTKFDMGVKGSSQRVSHTLKKFLLHIILKQQVFATENCKWLIFCVLFPWPSALRRYFPIILVKINVSVRTDLKYFYLVKPVRVLGRESMQRMTMCDLGGEGRVQKSRFSEWHNFV